MTSKIEEIMLSLRDWKSRRTGRASAEQQTTRGHCRVSTSLTQNTAPRVKADGWTDVWSKAWSLSFL